MSNLQTASNSQSKCKAHQSLEGKEFPCHDDQLANLRRIEGQIRGISRMIEERRYCVDILNQCRSVHAALEGVEKKIFHRHLDNCMRTAFSQDRKGDVSPLLDEIVTLFSKK